MGRSPSFCFSIKACVGDADDGDFSTRQEIKASPEKRRWSFRKKYAGHDVPTNTVISESLPIFSENQNQEANADTFNSKKALTDPEKASIVEQTSPTLQLPSAVFSSRVTKEFTSTSTILVDYNIPEHVVIVIQTSIRRCLAQNELQKLKNVVKLQAAARGYLVRRQAAGTLRCIQAIVKMQALVRLKQSDMELNKARSTIKKLVSSAFARQLLESTPKAKSIRISCDPLRPDSAWNWLERWMALTSMDQQNLVLNQDDLEKDMKNDLAAYDVDVGLHIIPQHASPDSEFAANSPAAPEVEEDLIIKSSSRELLAHACASDQFPTPVQDNELQSRVQETIAMENGKDWSKREADEVSDYISNQKQQPSDAILHAELDGNPSKHDYTEANFKKCVGNELSDADENEGGKLVNGSRKSKNPAFAAVQAKFEELSSAPDSNRYFDYASSEVVSVSKSALSLVDFKTKEVSEKKIVFSKVDSKVMEVNLKEKLPSHNPEGQEAASGYGTEISPDRPEDSLAEIVPELRTSDEINHGVASVANGSLKFDETKAETKTYLSNLVAVQLQRKAESSKNAAISVASLVAVQVDQQPAEITISSMHIQEEDAEDTHVDKPSPDGSPRSHTVADSPAASSNQISLHVRTAKVEDNIPARKKRSQLAVKNSPTHLKNDSNARSSEEHLRKGTKNVKRPNSAGSDKTNHVDEDRSSNNSLPSYMQLTESAKAKVNTSFSQKSIIGLHHKDNLIKKRHSLPIVNEKQGSSPRMRSPTSQTPRYLKGNDVPSDDSTERRRQI